MEMADLMVVFGIKRSVAETPQRTRAVAPGEKPLRSVFVCGDAKTRLPLQLSWGASHVRSPL